MFVVAVTARFQPTGGEVIFIVATEHLEQFGWVLLKKYGADTMEKYHPISQALMHDSHHGKPRVLLAIGAKPDLPKVGNNS